MTLIPFEYEIICSNCGSKNKHTYLQSHQTGNVVDNYFFLTENNKHLDCRSGDVYSSIFNTLGIQFCENCFYCSEDIGRKHKSLEVTLNSEEYKEILNNPLYHLIANKYRCSSYIYENNNQIEKAAWNMLNAAWNCDDNKLYLQAKICREGAIRLFELASNKLNLKLKNYTNTPKKGELPLLLIDLYRRTEQFEIASKICSIRLEFESDELLKKILLLQKKLIFLRDINYHKIEEALEKNKKDNLLIKKFNVINRRNEPLTVSNCHLNKGFNKKKLLLIKILEANIDDRINERYYSDISTFDIKFFMIKGGFNEIDNFEIFEILKSFKKASIINLEFINLGYCKEDFEEIITNKNEKLYLPKKRRRIWFNNQLFSELNIKIKF